MMITSITRSITAETTSSPCATVGACMRTRRNSDMSSDAGRLGNVLDAQISADGQTLVYNPAFG
jgi:hypothetical protein